MTVAPARSYNRSDWASAFVNVEQELTDVLHIGERDRAGGAGGTFYRNGPGVSSGTDIASINSSMATA